MQTRTIFSIFFLTAFGYMLYSGFNPAPENEVSSTADISKANSDTKSGTSRESILSVEQQDNSPLPAEDVTGIDSELELEHKLDRLAELEDIIDTGNNKLSALIVKYDQVLGDEEVRQELSTALLDSKQYRLSMIKKFKLERDLQQ